MSLYSCVHAYTDTDTGVPARGPMRGGLKLEGLRLQKCWKKGAEPDLRDGISQCPFLPPHPRAKVLWQEAQDLGQL